jgi:hypothetical protein
VVPHIETVCLFDGGEKFTVCLGAVETDVLNPPELTPELDGFETLLTEVADAFDENEEEEDLETDTERPPLTAANEVAATKTTSVDKIPIFFNSICEPSKVTLLCHLYTVF